MRLFTKKLPLSPAVKAVLVFVVLILLCPRASLADHPDSSTVRVGIFQLEPLNFLDKYGSAQGLFPDLIREMVKDGTWDVEFVPCNWAQCLEKLQNEEIDLMTTVAHSLERARSMDYSQEAVLDIWGQVFVRPGSTISDFLELEGLRVAIMRRDMNGRNFLKVAEKFGVECQIIEFASHDEIFKAVQRGGVDAGIAPQHFGLRNVDKYDVVGTSMLFSPFPVYFAAKKGRAAQFLSHVDSHLAGWKKDKNSLYYKKLSYWMGGRKYAVKTIPVWLKVGLTFFAGFFLFLLFINRTLKNQVSKQTAVLRASEREYRQLIEGVSSIILRWDKEGRIRFLNNYGQDLFGFSTEEIVGRHVIGTIVPATDSQGKDLGQLIEDILEEPGKYELSENENICRNGKRLVIQWSNQAICDEGGNFKEILSVGTDVTEQRDLEKDLRQAQKFEAIATLSGGIAHDFNNILSAVLGYAELAKLGVQHDQRPLEEIQEVIQASYRAKELVQQILAFSRKTPHKRLLIMPAVIVKESLKLLRATIPATVKLIGDVPLSSEKILADPVQIQQIVVNLCTNSLHAMNGGHGKIDVKLRSVELDEKDLAAEQDITPGRFVELSVSDNGAGIEPEDLERIFEPYFTTKEVGEGTGMGLAMVHSIARESSGLVRVESEPGQGTVVRIYFPILSKTYTSQEEPRGLSKDLPTGTERLMVVDDENTIIEIQRNIFENLGYEVVAFSDSKAALDEFTRNPGDYDLLITDQTMPGLTGLELTTAILKIRAELPIILCTGYSMSVTQEQATEAGVKAFMMKPVGVADMAGKVREVLDNCQEA